MHDSSPKDDARAHELFVLHCMWSDRKGRLSLMSHVCPMGGLLWTIGELLVGSLLDCIGFFGHFVIGLSVGIVCVIAVL